MFVLPKSCGGELPPVGTRVMFDIVQAAVVVVVLFTRFRGIGNLPSFVQMGSIQSPVEPLKV